MNLRMLALAVVVIASAPCAAGEATHVDAIDCGADWIDISVSLDGKNVIQDRAAAGSRNWAFEWVEKEYQALINVTSDENGNVHTRYEKNKSGVFLSGEFVCSDKAIVGVAHIERVLLVGVKQESVYGVVVELPSVERLQLTSSLVWKIGDDVADIPATSIDDVETIEFKAKFVKGS